MNRIQTYYLIGKLLSSDATTNFRKSIIKSLQSPAINWPLFISTGSNHLVLQTIYCKLKENSLTEYLPIEIVSHLKYIYDLNYRRNTEILQQITSINELLGHEGIVPLYLKGVGNIIDGLYKNIAERLMYDIDFLIPEHQWLASAEILLANGYLNKKDYNPNKRMEMKHYPTLSKAGARASIEIHRLPVDYEFSDIFGADEVWQQKKLIKGNNNSYVMCDRHKIIHNFIHSQLHHGGDLHAKVFLRNLYDLKLLSERENLFETFASMSKYQKQATNYLRVMDKGFGMNHSKNNAYTFASSKYTLRHELNLSSRFISLSTYFAFKIYHAYIKIPFQALTDKELRSSLIKRLSSKNWYKQHLCSYRHVLHGNTNIEALALKNSNLQNT